MRPIRSCRVLCWWRHYLLGYSSLHSRYRWSLIKSRSLLAKSLTSKLKLGWLWATIYSVSFPTTPKICHICVPRHDHFPLTLWTIFMVVPRLSTQIAYTALKREVPLCLLPQVLFNVRFSIPLIGCASHFIFLLLLSP